MVATRGFQFGRRNATLPARQRWQPAVAHRMADEVVPLVMAEQLYRAASGDSQLVRVQGAGHEDAVRAAERRCRKPCRASFEHAACRRAVGHRVPRSALGLRSNVQIRWQVNYCLSRRTEGMQEDVAQLD